MPDTVEVIQSQWRKLAPIMTAIEKACESLHKQGELGMPIQAVALLAKKAGATDLGLEVLSCMLQQSELLQFSEDRQFLLYRAPVLDVN